MLGWAMNLGFAAGAAAAPSAPAHGGRVWEIDERWWPTIIAGVVGTVVCLVP